MTDDNRAWLAVGDDVWVVMFDWGTSGILRRSRRGRVRRIDALPRSALAVFDGTLDVDVLFPFDEGRSWWRTELAARAALEPGGET